ncbi:two-component system, chemotaxis family, response regulator CheY [Rhizobium sp. RU35A]|uniref:Response regulator n=1 Tax=Rhizobium straminoryzae TaxID=1387186 RepID=A0A549T8J4_9HYPH|nr:MULTISPECIES: response regulator [Rhizobium]TRL38170.1 response regulator [Rhizobium straminoryzae]SIQ31228.1 two-component system, chemotaxis family, response regulator CheY [Rhizobium sp. RU35A]
MRTILVVDDSQLIQWVLQTALQKAAFSVELAGDGEEAAGKIENGLKPDLIITDLNMPNMNGLQLIERVRKVLKFTPILVVTTETQGSKRDEAKRLGATGWLTKPVQPDDLLRIIGKVLPPG